MDWDTFNKAIQYIGIPGAIIVALVFAGWKKWWVWGWQLVEKDEEIARLRTALDREREGRSNDVRMWQMVALSNNQQVSAALRQQERIVETVEKVAQPSQPGQS